MKLEKDLSEMVFALSIYLIKLVSLNLISMVSLHFVLVEYLVGSVSTIFEILFIF